MRLLLARHGESLWNAERRFQGTTDIALSARGRAQASALGRGAGRLPDPRRLREPVPARAGDRRDWRWPAPVSRWSVVEELRELSLGDWEGCTVDEVRARDGDPYVAWVRAPHDCPPPGGEPLPVVSERVRAGLDRIAGAHDRGDDVLVVAHGGVISVYACHLLGCSFNPLWRLRVDNASLTVVRPPRLVSLNETGHLPADARPRPPAADEPGRPLAERAVTVLLRALRRDRAAAVRHPPQRRGHAARARGPPAPDAHRACRARG